MKKTTIAAFAALLATVAVTFFVLAPSQTDKVVAVSKGHHPTEQKQQPQQQESSKVTVTIEQLDVAFKP